MTSAEQHGVLVVDKPIGLTSADVVARVKKALGARRVGHTGTLDPMATGVLPIVLGEATKLAAYLLAEDKEYEGELLLGVTTDTLDALGRVVDERDATGVREPTLCAAIEALVGDIDQVPPMYSALKQGGRRLYDLARKGIDVERAPRRIRIDRFELLAFAPPRASFRVACSKGTYVRSLVRDVGEILGVGAHLSALRRTRAGAFDLGRALPLDSLNASSPLVSPPDAVAHLPALCLATPDLARVVRGQPLPRPEGVSEEQVLRLLSSSGSLCALVQARGEKLAYLRVFNYGIRD
jgi:tRNA pseudouridine55 synthase